jgi:hypothetical protein
MALSIGNLLAITIDRCLFITKPLKYPRKKSLHFVSSHMAFSNRINANFVFFQYGWCTGTCNSLYNEEQICGKDLIYIYNFYIPIVMVFFLKYKIYNVAKIQRRKIRESCPGQEGEATKNTAGRRGHLQQIIKGDKNICNCSWCVAFLSASSTNYINSKPLFLSKFLYVITSATMIMHGCKCCNESINI